MKMFMNEAFSRIEVIELSIRVFQNKSIRKMIWLQNVMFSFIIGDF